ncbi:flagellar protein FlgN [Fredinandcohnia sp. 179-A 10B2 NHS]|uniref:flagellar protein FlgN n=1 Tax=Fredinandcohnia sp. 179-A 10B2 NHS TaxID=3235176 RepID=UPI0039A09602
MSAENLTSLLSKILVLHQNLYKLSEHKTDILKKGDIDALNEHMKEEQKYLLAIRQLENERIGMVEKLLGPRVAEKTLTKCIEVVQESHKTQLTKLSEELVEIVNKLKDVNSLNQQLTHQSLQFVNMTLDMLVPQEQTVNYGKPTEAKEQKQSRPMFDSKA